MKNFDYLNPHIKPSALGKKNLEKIIELSQSHLSLCIGNCWGEYLLFHCLYDFDHHPPKIIDLQISQREDKLPKLSKPLVWDILERYDFQQAPSLTQVKYICPETSREAEYLSIIDDELYNQLVGD